MQLDQTACVIEGFRKSVEEGSVIDLTGLDHSIEEMCNAINDLPADQRISVKKTLIGLIDELNALVDMLHIQQSKVSDGLKGIASRQQAVSAYGKGGNTVKAGKADPTK